MKKLLNIIVLVYILTASYYIDAKEDINNKDNNEKYAVLTLKTYGALSYEMDYYPDPNEVKINYSLIAEGNYDYDKNNIQFYSKKGCVDKIKSNIIEHRKIYATIYNSYPVNCIFPGAVRYICVPESIVKQNQTNGKPDVQKLFDKYKSNEKDAIIPMGIGYDGNAKDDINLFPFDSITNGNKEESKRLMSQIDKEIEDIKNKRYEASFDCNIDKLTDVERTICNYEDLGKLDIDLNNLYKQLLVKYSNIDDKKKRIIKTQKEWLTKRNKLDRYYKLKDSYEKRIEKLKKI